MASERDARWDARIYCDAPSDKGGRASWLVKQLRRASDELTVEAFSYKSKTPEIAALRALREDPTVVLRSKDKPPVRFRVAHRSEMGTGRRTVRKLGFADSVTAAVGIFYSDIVQHMQKAVAASPKMSEPTETADETAECPFLMASQDQPTTL